MKSKIVALSLALSLGASTAFAQDNNDSTDKTILRLDATARVDWQHDHTDGIGTVDDQSGFKGKYFMFRADGNIAPGFSYSWRQRLNKANKDQSFFDATDWVYINYAVDRWNFRAGKEIVSIGGWEYDRAPYDLYSTSVFWNNVPCYQLGVSAGYNITPSNTLSAQVTQSLFHSSIGNNTYAYNLMWNGRIGLFESIWSANLVEYAQGRYINYLSLGNKFHLGKWSLEFDFMNRASSHQTFLFRDCTIVGEIAYNPNARWRIHAKGTYDVNHSGTDADALVLNGTELSMAAAGVAYYPLLKDRTSLRIHADVAYSWGRNANTADVMQHGTTLAQVGVTWQMNLLNFKRK